MKPKRVARRALSARSISPPESKVVTALGEVDFSERAVTNSMRGTFLDCRRRALYQYGYRLNRRETPHYFVLGDMFHRELEIMYTDGYDRAASKLRINKLTGEALSSYTTPETIDKIWQANAIVNGAIPAYAAHYLTEDREKYDVLECEASFALPIPGTSWKYRGKTDMVVRERKKRGAVLLFENKTAASIDAGYVARLPLDHQILGYVWSIGELSGSLPSAVMYNPVKKTQLRQKQGESRGQYLDRVEQDYADNPQKYFYRERVPVEPAAVAAFVKELQLFVGELERAIESGYFSQNTRQCTMRGVCPYMPLCIGGPSEDNLLLYEKRALLHGELEDEEG